MEGIGLSALPSYQTISLVDMMRPRFSGGKIALPVEHYTPFAQFKHVSGVPAGDGAGFSINKLQMLDVLIDRLVKLKDRKAIGELPENPAGMSEAAMDALIDDLAKKVSIATAASRSSVKTALGPSFGMTQSQTGAVLSVLV